jgi:hypothetical protein
MTAHALETQAQQARWLIWIDTVEILTGHNLRRHDEDLDAALNAYLHGDSALDYANALRYPHSVSLGLLNLSLGVIVIAIVTAALIWLVRGDL